MAVLVAAVVLQQLQQTERIQQRPMLRRSLPSCTSLRPRARRLLELTFGPDIVHSSSAPNRSVPFSPESTPIQSKVIIIGVSSGPVNGNVEWPREKAGSKKMLAQEQKRPEELFTLILEE